MKKMFALMIAISFSSVAFANDHAAPVAAPAEAAAHAAKAEAHANMAAEEAHKAADASNTAPHKMMAKKKKKTKAAAVKGKDQLPKAVDKAAVGTPEDASAQH